MEKINVTNQKMFLQDASFVKLPQSQGQARAVLKDEILDFSLNGNTISFKYKRTLKAEPESIYNVFVVFYYQSDLTNDSIMLLEQNNNFNEEYLRKKAPSIAENTPLCSTASQIISSLTAVNGRPFISPPMFIKNS